MMDPSPPPESGDPLIPPGLFRKLDQALTVRQLTLLVAPSGYGKTTVMAAWLRHLQQMFVPWVEVRHTLTAHDNDLRVFVGHLVAAARAVRPGALRGLQAAAAELPALSPEQLANQFIRDIDDLPDSVLLILDDYSAIDAPQINAFVRTLIQRQPLSLHLAITSRTEPPLALGALLPHSRLSRLTAADLTLSDEQARALLAEAGAPAPETLVAAAGGHPLKLRLAGYLLAAGVPAGRVLGAFNPGGRRSALGALRELALGTLPDDQQQIVRRLAHLATLHTDLARYVLRPDDRPAGSGPLLPLLSPAARRVFFDVSNDADGPYHWQAHWREAPTEATQRIADDRRAAVWYIAHGYPDEAIDCLLAAGDEDAVADLVESLLPGLMDSDDWSNVQRLVGRVPTRMRHARPRLLLAQAWWAWLALERDTLADLVARTQQALIDTPPTPEEAALVGRELDILRGSPRYTTSPPAERLTRLQEMLEQLPGHSRRIRAEALAALRDATAPGPESDALATCMMREIAAAADNPTIQGRLMVELGRLYLRVGSVPQIETLCRAGIAQYGSYGDPVRLAAARLGLGIAAYCRDDPAQTKVQLEAVLRGPNLAGPEIIGSIPYYLAPVYARLNLAERIEPMMATLRHEIAPEDRQSPDDNWSIIEALAALYAGDLAAAVHWADSVNLALPMHPYWGKGIIIAEIRMAQGDPAHYPNGLLAIDRLVETVLRKYHLRSLNRGLAVRARLLWRMGERDAAARDFIEAIEVGYPLGYRSWFIDGGPENDELLALLTAEGPVRAEATKLQALRAGRIPMPQRQGETQAALTRRERELLQLLADGLQMKEIARRLHLSENTVRNHATNIYTKLDVAGRDAAVQRGRELGLLPR